MADNIPKFEDTTEIPEEAQAPKFEDTVDHPDNISVGTPNADKIEELISSAANAPGKAMDYVSSHILPGGKYLAKGAENAKLGAQEGISFGLRNTAIGGLKGLGKTALETATGELPKEKSAIQELMDNYYKYKNVEDEKLKAAHADGYGAMGGQIFGSIVGGGAAFKAAKALGLGGEGLLFANNAKRAAQAAAAGEAAPEIITPVMRAIDTLKSVPASAAMAGVQGFGESEGNLRDSPGKVLDDTVSGLEGGAVAGPLAEQVIAPAISSGLNKLINLNRDNSKAKQLAATILNAKKGGTLFGEAGPGIITGDTKQMASNIAKEVMGGVHGETNAMGEAFKQGAHQRLPDFENITADQGKIISDVREMLEKFKPGQFEDEFIALEKGEMSPQDANNFRTALKGYINELEQGAKTQNDQRLAALARKMRNSGLITRSIEDPVTGVSTKVNGLLEDLSKNAGTDIQQLNENIANARSQVDPFMQEANRVIEDPTQHFNWSSASSPAEQEAQIRDTLHNAMKKAGRVTRAGSEGRNLFEEYQSVLDRAKAANPRLNINPAKSARDMQQQSYLYAAKDAAQGIREATKDSGVFNFAAKQWGKGTEFLAEKLAGNKKIQEISEKLLSKDPKTIMDNARALQKNPKTAKLAEDLIKGHELNNKQRITNTTFQIMQNPIAKQLLKSDDTEGEGNVQ